MTEGLREVAEQLPSFRVDLFGEQAEIVGAGDGPLKYRGGSIKPISDGECLRQPEGTQQEGALVSIEAVGSVAGLVAVDQPAAVGQPLFDGIDRGEDPRVRRGQEPTMGIMRLAASNAVEPKYCVNAPASSFHASRITVSLIWSRCCFQLSVRSDACSRSDSAMARSSAAQHITLEYTKC